MALAIEEAKNVYIPEADESLALAVIAKPKELQWVAFVRKQPKLIKTGRVISTLIRSRQTPKLSRWNVYSVIEGRSEPTVEVINH